MQIHDLLHDGRVAILVDRGGAAESLLLRQGVDFRAVTMPDEINLSLEDKEIVIGKQTVLSVDFGPSDADRTGLVLSSSDESVATVAPDGTVTGLSGGTARLRAEALNGVTGEIKITVRKPVYRALLVANVKYSYENCKWNAGDIEMLTKMLSSVTAPDGEPWQVTVMYDLYSTRLEAAIKSAFADTREGDVSLFHISSHGDLAAEGAQAGRIKMTNPSGVMTYVPYATLRQWMDAYIRGQTILFLEACSSGSAIDSRAGAAFRSEGYYVITSARYRESCWSNRGSHNYFVQWLTKGVGTSGPIPADSDGDGILTLGELHAYVSRVGDNHTIYDDGFRYYQHSTAYPENSDFPLFRRK